MKVLKIGFLWICSLIFLLQLNVNGQNRSVDSLLMLYDKENSDSVKINLLLQISHELSESDNYKEAYEYYNMFIQYEDSIENIAHQKLLSETRLKYESDKTEKELELLEKEAEINKLQLKRSIFITYSLVGIICFIIIIAILFIQIGKIKSGQEVAVLTQKNLNQQLNPKFIIETVNSIQHSLFQDDKASTNQYLSKFSKLMRLLLDNSQYQQIHLQNELDMIELYLNLQRFRSKNSIDYIIKIDSSIDPFEIKIPSFILMYHVQKLVNGKVLNKKEIMITIRKVNKEFLCSIYECDIDQRTFVHDILDKNTDKVLLKQKRNKTKIYKGKFAKKNINIKQSEINNSLNNCIGSIVDISIPFDYKS